MISRTQEDIMQEWPQEWKTPVVSVRCLTYNQEAYIAQALDGFLMQKTNFPFEIVVHDDASTDNTANIIREYEKKFPRIVKAIYETENQYKKADGSLQRIMDAACSGEFIAVCEGDDYWIDPLKLKKQVDYLKSNPKCGLVRTEINRLYQKSGKIEPCFFTKVKDKNNKDTLEDYILFGWFAAPCTWMYRANIPPRPVLDRKEYFCGDLLTILNIASFSEIHFMNDVTAMYRIAEESASHFANPTDYYRFWCRVKNTRKYYARQMSLKFRIKFFVFLKKQHVIQLLSLLFKLLMKKCLR